MWDIGWTDEFEEWILSDDVDASVREDVRACLVVLREIGPSLGRPLADTIKGSRHPNMKELRVQSKGRPIRLFYAFDPQRKAMLLIGGNKQGQKRFYEVYVPIADRLFDQYLEECKHGGAKRKT
ncbi:MAG TPA: type II toxin-antitoxin system RelE/ParE family toxin [Tepidisphaeraceae bacterium]|jgi:hypothetical protein|nr:type II toxin-antitoxin system RelE/ParE family toxin [Tepidisphaeraceae bacterium]